MPECNLEAPCAEVPGFRLRLLAAGIIPVAVTGGVLAYFLTQAVQIPPLPPRPAAERVSDDTPMDWRPEPRVHFANVAPVE